MHSLRERQREGEREKERQNERGREREGEREGERNGGRERNSLLRSESVDTTCQLFLTTPSYRLREAEAKRAELLFLLLKTLRL